MLRLALWQVAGIPAEDTSQLISRHGAPVVSEPPLFTAGEEGQAKLPIQDPTAANRVPGDGGLHPEHGIRQAP